MSNLIIDAPGMNATAPTVTQFLTYQVKTKLPESLADLLHLAITDARSLSRDKYTPYWGDWHFPEFSSSSGERKLLTCKVCLAGAVIAGRLQLPADKMAPDSAVYRILEFEILNALREGHYEAAYADWCRLHDVVATTDVIEALECLPMPDYSNFLGWEEFEHHLTFLEEEVLPTLRRLRL